jgi:hypothetical protein
MDMLKIGLGVFGVATIAAFAAIPAFLFAMMAAFIFGLAFFVLGWQVSKENKDALFTWACLCAVGLVLALAAHYYGFLEHAMPLVFLFIATAGHFGMPKAGVDETLFYWLGALGVFEMAALVIFPGAIAPYLGYFVGIGAGLPMMIAAAIKK